MRTAPITLCLLFTASLGAQALPVVTAAPPFSSMSRVPVSDFASDVVAAPDVQEHPAVASDGTNAMAVWADRRYGNFDVFASRLDAYGQPIDKLGIPVAPTYFDDYDPAIAWSGSDYGVVWATQYGIFFARISPAGAVSGPQKIFDTFVANRMGLAAPAIAWNGSEYLVAFSFEEPNTSGATLDGVLVAADGSPRSNVFSISEALTGATNPSIATDGSNFLVAWDETQPRRVMTALVSAEGTVSARKMLGNLPPAGPRWTSWYSSYAFPHVAFRGSEYAVVWTDWVLHAQLLTAGGDPAGVPRTISDPARIAITPSLTAIDDGWIVVWSDSPTSPYPSEPDTYNEDLSSFNVELLKLGRDLAPLSPPNSLDPSHGGVVSTAIARRGAGAVAVWQDPTNVYDTALNANAQAPGTYGPLIAYGIENQKELAVAVSGDIALVVWASPDTNTAFWRRYRADGTPFDAEPSGVWFGDPVGFSADPNLVAVAASDHQFLIAFTDAYTHSVIGKIIERDGGDLDPWGLPIATLSSPFLRPGVASDGQHFLVTWSEDTDRVDFLGNPLEQIRAAIVTADGKVVTSRSLVIAPSADVHQRNPVATWAGDRYAVAWSTFEQSVYPLTGISMRYVGPAGDPVGEPFVVEDVRHYGQHAESIAAGGGLVAIGAGFPDYGSLYFVDRTAISQVTRVGPFVLWDGARFVSGDVPMASFGDGRNVAVGSELIRMLPQSHAGGVERVYVGFFNSLRTRAVRRN